MKRILSLLSLALLLLCACNKEDSPIGLDLQDPATLYNGIADTLNCTAYTVADDSLNTTNYSQGLIGFYHDATFGDAEARVFAHIANNAEGGIDYTNSNIDSTILSLSLQDPFPKSVANLDSVQIHFEVCQLAEAIKTKDADDKDYIYYSFDEIPVDPSMVLFDGTVTMKAEDTVVRLPLNSKMAGLLHGNSFANNAAMTEALKGIRIRIVGGNDMMFTLNFTASTTGLFVYRNVEGDTAVDLLTIGAGGTHFNQFILNHTGALASLASQDSIAGTSQLFLEPMGGTRIRLNFDAAIKQFKQDHPYAVIHYAELQLPVASTGDEDFPSSLVVMKKINDTLTAIVPDMADPFSSGTLNYRYDKKTNSYRLRLTQHLQGLIRSGYDLGTYVLINSRRSSANRVIINGTNAAQPTRMIIVYTEL